MTDEQRAVSALYGQRSGTVRQITLGQHNLVRMDRLADLGLADRPSDDYRRCVENAAAKVFPYGGNVGHDLQRLDQRRRDA